MENPIFLFFSNKQSFKCESFLGDPININLLVLQDSGKEKVITLFPSIIIEPRPRVYYKMCRFTDFEKFGLWGDFLNYLAVVYEIAKLIMIIKSKQAILVYFKLIVKWFWMPIRPCQMPNYRNFRSCGFKKKV